MRRRKAPLSLDRYLEERTGEDRTPAELPGNLPDPTRLAEEAEIRHLALSTLRDMPDHYRTALFMKASLRRPVEEIAETLGKSLTATKSILYRARASMRRGVATYLDRGPDPD